MFPKEKEEKAGLRGGTRERGFKLHILKHEKHFINNNNNNVLFERERWSRVTSKKATRAQQYNINGRVRNYIYGHKSYLSFRLTLSE